MEEDKKPKTVDEVMACMADALEARGIEVMAYVTYTVWEGEEVYGGYSDEWEANDVARRIGGEAWGPEGRIEPSEDQKRYWKDEEEDG